MAIIKEEHDFKTVTELRDFLNSIEDPHMMQMPQGDVFQTRILEDENGKRYVHIWVMFRGTVVDMTDELEALSKPDVGIDETPSMAARKEVPRL